MQVAQFFDALFGGSHVEIVVPSMPERGAFRMGDSFGDVLLQYLNGDCQGAALWFADQKMYVFGHNNIADYA